MLNGNQRMTGSTSLNNQAFELYNAGRLKESEKLSERILTEQGENYGALINLGNIKYLQKNWPAASEFYQRALKCRPGDSVALINLANTSLEQKNFALAVRCADAVPSKDSLHAQAMAVKGDAAMGRENFKEAAQWFKEALKEDKDNFWYHNYLGQALQKEGAFSEALQASLRAVELSGGADSQQINFGYALYEIALEKGVPFIKKYLRRWQSLYPQNNQVRYIVSALDSDGKFDRADADYVKNIFDFYADNFEDSLQDLEYVAPQKITEEIRRSPFPAEKILDLGCGTGLCGKALAKLFPEAALTGVDLSSGMLRKAKESGVYKELICADAAQFLKEKNSCFDLVTAADVLTYFGSLKDIFAAVAGALKPQGHFIFSVSRNTLNDKDYFLHLSGRFVHRREYVESMLAAAGMHTDSCREVILRQEAGNPVRGWIFMASAV